MAAMADALAAVEHEVRLLQDFIVRLGTRQPDGLLAVPFGVLYDDPASQQTFEALAGTLKASAAAIDDRSTNACTCAWSDTSRPLRPTSRQAAKKRGVVSYASPLLLKGAHDKVPVVLLKEPTD